MKKTYLVLIAGLIVLSIPISLATTQMFTDVSGDEWFIGALDRLNVKGIVTGYPDNTFRPSNNINRAEVAVIADRVMIYQNAKDLGMAMLHWANSQNPPQEVHINGRQIISSSLNAGDLTESVFKKEGLDALMEIISHPEIFGLDLPASSAFECLYKLKYGNDISACNSLGEITTKPVEFSTEDTKEISFDGCGKITNYEDMPWYEGLGQMLEESTSGEGYSYTFEQVSEACYSENGDMFLFLAPRYAGGKIFKYLISSDKLEEAMIDTKDEQWWYSSPSEFGQRQGNIIPVWGTDGDAGYGATMYYDYNFIENIVELKKVYRFDADDPDGGSWEYY